MTWQSRRNNPEIEPDEIFLDASNAPEFDRARFEGRIERPLSRSTFFVLASFLGILTSVLAVRAGYLQIIRGEAFAAQSANNSLEATLVFAPRGVITDRNGVVLADNTEREDQSTTTPLAPTMGRRYPFPAFGQIIGYVSYPKKDKNGVYYDTNETGIAGLEAKYDDLLNGENGKLLTEKDALGKVRSEGVVVSPKEGQTLRLTLDASLEADFIRALSDIARSEGFIAGGGAIMDVHTGEVLAIVSYPSYDPNVMAEGSPAATIAAYNDDPGHPFLDHAVQGVYTPGSIVKPFIAAGALTDGLITQHTVITDPGSLSLPDQYHPGKYFIYKGWRALGAVDVTRAIAWSSDVFFYTVGGGFEGQRGLGIDRLDYWYRAFGLGAPTGIDLPQEASGLIPTPEWKEKTFNEPWYLGDTYFTAIGQYSTQVTPIQMARATAALVNGGKLVTPTLVLGAPPTYITVPVDPSALDLVKTGMRKAVTEALASALNLPYVSIAAKTGTAQTGVHNQYDNSWVIGFFPYDNPRYAFSVVLERGPQGAGEQSVNVMRRLFDLLHADNSVYAGGTGVPASTTP